MLIQQLSKLKITNNWSIYLIMLIILSLLVLIIKKIAKEHECKIYKYSMSLKIYYLKELEIEFFGWEEIIEQYSSSDEGTTLIIKEQ